MTKCSVFLTIKEMQVKMSLREFIFTPVRKAVIKNTTNTGEDVGEKKPLYAVGGNAN
jgi:hypothetical protein